MSFASLEPRLLSRVLYTNVALFVEQSSSYAPMASTPSSSGSVSSPRSPHSVPPAPRGRANYLLQIVLENLIAVSAPVNYVTLDTILSFVSAKLAEHSLPPQWMHLEDKTTEKKTKALRSSESEVESSNRVTTTTTATTISGTNTAGGGGSGGSSNSTGTSSSSSSSSSSRKRMVFESSFLLRNIFTRFVI